jgi:hypothetical protein
MMLLRFPDCPLEIFPSILSELDKKQEEFDNTLKLDGWRTLTIKDPKHEIVKSYLGGSESWACGKDKDLFFLSKRGLNKGGPTRMPVSPEIVVAVDALNLPSSTMLDAEWLERRTQGDNITQSLWLLDVMWLNDEWKGKEQFKTRLELLSKILPLQTVDELLSKPIKPVSIPGRPNIGMTISQFFERTKSIPWTEGIVIRKLSSPIVGDREKCCDNASMLKAKWRSGCSGREVYKFV